MDNQLTDTELANLKAFTMAALDVGGKSADEINEQFEAFQDVAGPETVLTLIQMIESLKEPACPQ